MAKDGRDGEPCEPGLTPFRGGGASRSWEILEQFSDFHHGILKVFPTGLTLSS
jgi:hypothetical protein